VIIVAVVSFLLGREYEALRNNEIHKDITIIGSKAMVKDENAIALIETMHKHIYLFSNKELINTIENNYKNFKEDQLDKSK
jgi:hypothetical protein